MPSASGEFERRVCPENSREPRLRAANGARRHPRLQREGRGCSRCQILAPQKNPRRLRRGECRGSQRDAPPLSEGVRIRHEPMDSCDGRGGELRGGAYTQAGLGGDHPDHPGASSRSEVAESQKVDHLPRPPLRKKKRRRDRLMEVAAANPETWAVGFLDECWWSRVALPTLSSFSEEGKPMRLIQQSVAKDDPEPKAVSCYGLYLPELDETWLRFVDGRPVSSITTRFLSWCAEKLEAAGKKAMVLIWDNASWHISREVRRWLGKQSPWLNAIEPKWVHGKRKVVEPDGLLGAYELADRVCRVFGCPHYEHLSVPRKVA